MMQLRDLTIKTNPFLTEKQREFWGEIERRVQEEYKARSLPEYVKDELYSNDQNLTDIASRLGVDYKDFYRLMRQIGIVPLTGSKVKDKREELEKRIQKEHNMPLCDYIYKRYHPDECGLRPLAKELGISRQTLANWMEDMAIQRRKPSETAFGMINGVSPKKGKTYEEIYGAERAGEIKTKLSKSSKGKQS